MLGVSCCGGCARLHPDGQRPAGAALHLAAINPQARNHNAAAQLPGRARAARRWESSGTCWADVRRLSACNDFTLSCGSSGTGRGGQWSHTIAPKSWPLATFPC